EFGATLSNEASVEVMVRIERNICTLSIDTSGTLLHKRGLKQAMAKAPIRETMAALLLRQCGYRGEEPVLDPMCGSGTFILEAAEIAQGLLPGRVRNFAFEQLPSFNAEQWQQMKMRPARETPQHFFGFDRDAGAIKAATANAQRAGVQGITSFALQSIGQHKRPEGPPGLVICNPPYGARIGDIKKLSSLYASFGQVMRQGFSGWRVGLVTNEVSLAKATALPFQPPSAPILHGGIKIRLYQTSPLR
ncbi:MAG: class I SAM-dependent RNA methyltransferase, partial [Aestuariivirga sp.]